MPLEENPRAKIADYFKGRTKTKLGLIALLLIVACVSYFAIELRPADARARGNLRFEVQAGDGFLKIVDGLSAVHLIRSNLAFKTFSLLTGAALRLKPGYYLLSPSMSSVEILSKLTSGRSEVTVTVPEGASVYDVDRLLSEAGVVKSGSLIALNASTTVEGKLFPDTYKFFSGSSAEEVAAKFLDNFNAKVGPLLASDKNATADLVLASLVQKEVQTEEDMRFVAGILLKRLKVGLPLQVDSTICYIKKATSADDQSCYPLTPLDFKVKSPYNTYLNKGLPPTPISSPGLAAVEATLQPKSSPYWFYLSDPVTKKTVYSATFEEHDQNRATYLK